MQQDTTIRVSSHGYTIETFALAEGLTWNHALRKKLQAMLEAMGTEISYSGQDFDRQQAMASLLADILRERKAKRSA